ncbi:glycerophosphodiester phosphodiesterase [Parvularcula sp. ZS-1/3]|uniref:Glycerophosphodiester phosphodiesterase n=1 Tax=Parvularcula mediterranea TaxID=2732508 RepID=A0A7Y3RKK4_9PROT|nr:glycerophosphodiester phosphodiesterase family protein [Parvularcula mediterranea]NNU15266.1 glycerophosphodiester phosphodiesterase [Parvularcula mediterranea]
MRGLRYGLGLFIAAAAAVYAFNASWLAPKPDRVVQIIAHRGVAQTYSREGLTNETCTATRIFPPTHEYLENTIRSMRAAFDYGADVVEIDIHATTDGEFAVFHDWTVDCRTEGSGRTIDKSMAELKALDIGYGYTADGGETFPFRGKGVGLVPTLGEVLDAFPEERFFINAKSNNPRDAEKLYEYLSERNDLDRDGLFIVTGPKWLARWREIGGPIPASSRAEGKACAKGYLARGWMGHVPDACSEMGIGVPLDLRHLYWGWPSRLENRFEETPFGVTVTGRLKSIGGGSSGIDTAEDLALLPDSFSGTIMTDRIDVIGPLVQGSETAKR